MGKCFEQASINPAIKQAIERLCELDGEALHQATIDEILKDPGAA